MKKTLISKFSILTMAAMISACTGTKTTSPDAVQQIITHPDSKGGELVVDVERGTAFNHPLIAIWVENEDGGFIQTIYLSKSFASGIFRYGVTDGTTWKPGPRRRPAALPYYAHKLGVKTSDGLYLPTPENPVADAVSGATPTGSFIVHATTNVQLKRFKVLLEINQPWDFNVYWTNNRYPNDDDYKTSGQPALVYSANINTDSLQTYVMKPIGYSSYNGKDGDLTADLSTLTTALNILARVKVTYKY